MATYYVRTDGSNGNTGTTNSSGGAWADPGYAASQMGVDDICYVKAGTYTLTTSTAGAGGPVVLPTNVACAMLGFETTPGDGCPTNNRPVLDAGAQTSLVLFALDGAEGENQTIAHMEADGQLNSGVTGFDGTGNTDRVVNCVARDCVGGGFKDSSFISCAAITTSTSGNGFFANEPCFLCIADGHSVGFSGIGNRFSCIATNCNTNGFDEPFGYRRTVANCVAYSCGGDGFSTRNTATLSGTGFVNCVAINNGAFGFEINAGGGVGLLNCASYGNTSGRTDGNEAFDDGSLVLTGDPFVDAANNDFRLNDTSGAGASCRDAGIGIPGQTRVVSVGAVEYTAAAGGGGAGAGIYIPSVGRFGVSES